MTAQRPQRPAAAPPRSPSPDEAPPRPLVIDSHLHVWSEDRERYPRSDTPYRASPELLLEYLDEAGVDHAVIVLPMYYRYDNRFLADTLRRYPGKFAGVGVVDPRGPAAADALARLVEVDGIQGVRLRATIEEDAFGDPSTAPLWQAAERLRVPICLLGRPEHVATMRALAERFPQTRVVIDHFANIPARDGIESAPFQTFLSLADFPNVYIKLSGYHNWGVAGLSSLPGDPSERRFPFPLAQPLIRAAVERFGSGRVMWGSDWPHVLFGTGYVRNLGFARRELPWLTDEQRVDVLGRTALRLWSFQPPP